METWTFTIYDINHDAYGFIVEEFTRQTKSIRDTVETLINDYHNPHVMERAIIYDEVYVKFLSQNGNVPSASLYELVGHRTA